MRRLQSPWGFLEAKDAGWGRDVPMFMHMLWYLILKWGFEWEFWLILALPAPSVKFVWTDLYIYMHTDESRKPARAPPNAACRGHDTLLSPISALAATPCLVPPA